MRPAASGLLLVLLVSRVTSHQPPLNQGSPLGGSRVEIGARTYLFLEDGKYTSAGAVAACERYGLEVSALETLEENDLILAFMLDPTNGELRLMTYWTSLKKPYRSAEWRWGSGSQSSLDYTDWTPGEPDLPVSQGDACMRLSASTGWFDDSCSAFHFVLCEQYP